MSDYGEYRDTTGLPDYDFSNEAYRAGYEDGHRMVSSPVRDSEYRGTPDFDAYRAGYNRGVMEFTGSRSAMRKGAPFGGYSSWDECIQQNQDADDPEAYCGAIKRDTEGRRRVASVRATCEACGSDSRYLWDRYGELRCFACANAPDALPDVVDGEVQPHVPEWHSLRRTEGRRRVAHDTGARTTIQHCPFCGSGSVYARSDGAAQCDFSDHVFTVQLQPTHSGTPGTVDGESYDPFEDGAIEDEDPALDPGEDILDREARLHAAWLESQNHTRGVPRGRSGRLRH